MVRKRQPSPEIFKPSPAIKLADAEAFVEKLRSTPLSAEEIQRRQEIGRRVDKLRESMPPIYEDLKAAVRKELEERGH